MDHRTRIHQEFLDIIDQIPLTHVLLSMPGVGPPTAAKILMTIGDFSDFTTAAELASYAGLCSTTNQSGTSIDSHSVNRAGNKKLRTRLRQSSYSAIRHDERSRQYYERKHQGRKTT
ncbi:transposase [Corynebacterium parakroppenstedtii]|uniref:transposase n=1 Tax=Corynebacterium parakroppenstedtii TaxID=2828363 RepID=UPI000797BE77|nr:transposase [Corynebacterium parakroppenstedtii]KXB49697.1 transposase, IS116/IS110/IS902 family [Corynebacterium kroppenstedtii]MCF6820917.1 IS110 family transposase [Corynebacterium parakroppenstedtii]UWY22447.1 IS110 family transposase [Corynebacterium kroppenstedtii]